VTEMNKTPGAVVAHSKITKSMLGGDEITIVLCDVDGNEIEQFSKGQELQNWLTREGYVYFTGSRGVWVKAPKVPSKENAA
jgi:hypothetical protein